jgi:pheromone shutdown protein TraB
VAERDAYMANGLNTLIMFPVIVAVMGIAYVDGVEQYLQRATK